MTTNKKGNIIGWDGQNKDEADCNYSAASRKELQPMGNDGATMSKAKLKKTTSKSKRTGVKDVPMLNSTKKLNVGNIMRCSGLHRWMQPKKQEGK